MGKIKSKTEARGYRRQRIRAKIVGTAERPRLSVFRSHAGIYAQLIDDMAGRTIASAHTREIKLPKKSEDQKLTTKVQVGFEVGKLIAKRAQDRNISTVVFDRGGYQYHGRVKAVADGARAGGLVF